MKIVAVASSFPRFSGDPAGAFLLDLASGLAALGHEVHHVVPGAQGSSEFEECEAGVFVHRVPLSEPVASLAYGDGMGPNLRRAPWRIRHLGPLMNALEKGAESLLEETQATLLMSHWAVPGGLVGARLKKNSPELFHLSTLHGGGIQLLAAFRPLRWLLKRWARSVDHAVFVSDDLQRKAQAALPHGLTMETSVQSMGLRCEKFRPQGRCLAIRQQLGLSPGQVVVLVCGRLVTLKGADLLLHALHGKTGITVLVAGDGPERQALEILAQKQQVDARFLGRMDHARLPELMEAADIFCQPSRLGPKGRSEGTPVAVLEAQAAGLPVIASNTGGLPEIVIDGRDGLLFEPDDSQALREALGRMVTDHDFRKLCSQQAMAASAAHDYTQVAAHFGRIIESGNGAHA